jgi:heterodisulfide reductase subunit C
MTFQFLVVLALAIGSALYFIRGLARPARSGGCSDCGSCKSGCPAKRLEAIQNDLNTPKARPHTV